MSHPVLSSRHVFLFGVMAAAVSVGLLLAGAQDPSPQADASDQQELTQAERELARRLADGALRQQALLGTGPLYVARIELLRVKVEEGREAARWALVTHYRYQGDLTIVARVNLTRQAVASVDTASGVGAPLAEEEFERARKLALADPRVARALGDTNGVVVEPLVTRSADPKDPLFGHRVVRLLFRKGPNYFRAPAVMVDLFTSTVLLEPAGR